MKFQVGYLPLTDAAPVIAAAELGFAAEEGIEIVLSREPSWATLRDRLALDHLDAAHMLAPLALASRLGISGPPADLQVPVALNLNGNALTVSTALWEAMAPESDKPADVARAFASVARERAIAGTPLTLGTVHPFSCHTYQIRLFCELGGLEPRHAPRLVVVPPPNTVEALSRGIIDGFCVGAPWNSIAAAEGIGRIALLCCEIVPDCIEKVLAVHSGSAETTAPLVRAVRRAGLWCADPSNLGDLAELLSEKGGLGSDTDLIRRSLSGHLIVDAIGHVRTNADYLRFGEPAEAPRPDQARWLIAQMELAGQIDAGLDVEAALRATFRAHLVDVL